MHCCHRIAPVPVEPTWRIWVNASHESSKNLWHDIGYTLNSIGVLCKCHATTHLHCYAYCSVPNVCEYWAGWCESWRPFVPNWPPGAERSLVQGGGPTITSAIWNCCKTFSQWQCSFYWKLHCHCLKGLWQRQITLVIQGPRLHFSQVQ